MKGFRQFLLRGNVIELAVAVVMGVAFNAVIHSFVADIITPLIAAAGGTASFANLHATIGSTAITYGAFLNSVISFIVIAAVVYYLLVAPMARIIAHRDRNRAATERDCPECLSQIPVAATRCKFCTATVPPVEQAASPAAGGS